MDHILFPVFNYFVGISDISSQTSQHTMVTQNIKDGILTVAKQTSDLKVDLRNLRRIQQLNNESMTDSIQETIKKITVSQYCIYFTVLETSAPWEIFTPRSKILVILFILFWYVKVTRQFGYLTKNLQKRDTTLCTT